MSRSWKKRKTWVLSQVTCGCHAWVIVGGHVRKTDDLYCWTHSEERRLHDPMWDRRGYFVASTSPKWTPGFD